jgi:hypothetical protein
MEPLPSLELEEGDAFAYIYTGDGASEKGR